MRNILFLHSTLTGVMRMRLAGAHRYLKTSRWNVRLVEMPLGMPHLREIFDRWNPIGLIIERGAAPGKSPTRVIGGIPTVFCDQRENGGRVKVWNIRHDSAATAALAFRELKGLHPRHYAFVRDARKLGWSAERERTFVRLVRQSGASVDVLDDDARLSQNLSALPKPCGVFAANDNTARTTINAAILAGLDLPDDLQIVGVNNDAFLCENAEPTLTSIQPDIEYSGYLAMETLRRIVLNPKLKPRTLHYGPQLVVRRASTRLFPKGDPRVTKALDIIAAGYSDPQLTTDVIARRVGCSRRLLDLRFGEITGHTVRDAIRTARLDAARRLANDPTRGLSQIPILCGYASAGTFMSAFKRETGLTLGEFRRKRRP